MIKNVIIFGTHMSSSVHSDSKGKCILTLREGPTQGLDDTTLTVRAKHPINFKKSGKRFVSSLQYNGRNNFLFLNATKLYHLKATNKNIKSYPLSLGNISNDFTNNNKEKTRSNGVIKFFSVDFNSVDTNVILDIHK